MTEDKQKKIDGESMNDGGAGFSRIPDLVKLLADNGYEILSAARGVDKYYGSLNGVVTVSVRRVRGDLRTEE